MYQEKEESVDRQSVDQGVEAKNSRILNRKQIEKRLQGLKVPEYEKIITNLQNQNNRLKQQVEELSVKVEELMRAKKISHTNTNPVIEDQIKTAKKELDIKYEKMNYLKDQIKKSTTDELNEDLKLRLKEQGNQIHSLDQDLKVLTRQKVKQIEMYNSNMEEMEEYVPRQEHRDKDERINGLKEENKELKKRVNKLSIEMKVNDKASQETIDKLYNLKHEESKFMQLLLDSKKDKKKSMITQSKTIDVNEINQMKREIDELKRMKKESQKQLVNERILKDQKKTKLEKQAKDYLQYHKELLRRRMKALNHLNLYEAKDKQHKELQDIKQKKQAITVEDKYSQTDKIIPKDFRKQWIGKSEGFLFDDSLILDYRSQISIKAVLIYKTAEHIVFMKFFYESNLKKRYESKIPIQSSVLRKYESKKYTARPGSFLKNFKVSLTNDKITKIELIWSDGDISLQGWDTDSSTKYTADIGADQRPISMFGSIAYHGKNNYALQSLGCEVNMIENE